MYEYLSGKLTGKTPTTVTIEVQGVGFRVEVSLRTSEQLPEDGSDALIFVHHKVQDDRFRLFGFAERSERELFLELIGVAGVGPAHALALLSALDPDELWGCIGAGDARRLSHSRGIGPKIAQRVCSELGEKARRHVPGARVPPAGGEELESNEDAVAALLVLGYSESQAEQSVKRALESVGRQADVQQVIREALQGG